MRCFGAKGSADRISVFIYGHLGLKALVASVFHTDSLSVQDGKVLSHVESTKTRKRGNDV